MRRQKFYDSFISPAFLFFLFFDQYKKRFQSARIVFRGLQIFKTHRVGLRFRGTTVRQSKDFPADSGAKIDQIGRVRSQKDREPYIDRKINSERTDDLFYGMPFFRVRNFVRNDCS